MDPLSDVLELLKLRGYVSGGFDAGGAWAVEFGRHDGIKFHAVITGECWLSVEGVSEPLRVGAGECFLLAKGRPFRIASDLSVKPVDFTSLIPAAQEGRVLTHNGGGEYFSIGGYFVLDAGPAALLLDQLPPVIHICEEPARSTLRWCVERMQRELIDPQPGAAAVVRQLAAMVLVEALRSQPRREGRGGVGWLFALADKQIRAAMEAMHEAPGHRWTLQELAHRAAMSRTRFAIEFKKSVGMTPMDYLTRWRMLLAADRLTRSRDSIAQIASSFGYESEKSFGTAFKRVMKHSPRRYGIERTVVSET
jgi:AraC-like DNA-binding protein